MIELAESRFHDLVQEDRVHGSIYYDEAVFELEMERIFEQEWVFLGLESEVSRPGDFISTFIGRTPVIVARDKENDDINVMLNRCRHRAAAVCVEEKGNATFFRCPFHGWTYNNRGRLVGVPHKKGYGPSVRLDELSLDRAPRFASYRGFMFASLGSTGSSLEEHLGEMRSILDTFVDQSPVGEVEVRAKQKYRFRGNWKWELENTVDGYHVESLHSTFVEYLKRTANSDISSQYAMSSPVRVMAMGRGHAAIHLNPAEGVAKEAYDDLLGFPYTAVVFPNLTCVGVSIRYHRPIAPMLTETTLLATALKGVPESVNAQRMRSFELMDGRAGIITPDDGAIYDRQAMGLAARKNEWLLLARGLETESRDEERGVVTGDVTSECAIRGIHQWCKAILA